MNFLRDKKILRRSKKKNSLPPVEFFNLYYKFVVTIMDPIGTTRIAQRLLREVFTTFFTINVMF